MKISGVQLAKRVLMYALSHNVYMRNMIHTPYTDELNKQSIELRDQLIRTLEETITLLEKRIEILERK